MSKATAARIPPATAPANDHVPTRPAGFGVPHRAAREIGVRALDIVVASVALVLLAPVMLLVALVIVALDPGPVLFRQNRIGRDGAQFGCLKFRTMVVDAEKRLARLLAEDPAAAREWAETQKLRRDPRVTPIGDFLRRTSLDELPQLFNILAGQMSLVGPRPIVEDEIPRYGERFALYCQVRPGLTGLWQISGRSDVRYFERVLLDARYVSSRTLVRDVRIILLTVPRVLAARGSC
ncbi:MAG: sugar transferase [Erythrobacter sp.]|jgi:lipopolysaccharide/colanic/teichoic acid biosynthesis glycosyltransferase|nr:sugar transferase [Erythrobacter sp.]